MKLKFLIAWNPMQIINILKDAIQWLDVLVEMTVK